MGIYPEFKSWQEIKKFQGLGVVITEKIDGSSAQICVTDEDLVVAGSRTRWLVNGTDNFGFAAWVQSKEDELRKFLGVGRHYGEWYGAGIQNGYGLKEKRLALFNTEYQVVNAENPLPEQVDRVPILYAGKYTPDAVKETYEKLLKEGSRLIPGWTRPEGIVLKFTDTGVLRKMVFTPEESQWRGTVKEKVEKDQKKAEMLKLAWEQAAPYLQPIRLQKLFSRDERYLTLYPNSLKEICTDYVTDLLKEQEVSGGGAIALKRVVFPWVKQMIEENTGDPATAG